MNKEYSNGEITVIWEPRKCIHSANCVNGLPSVFNTSKKPWINAEGASSDEIVAQVRKCPSGALRIKGDTFEPEVVEDESIAAAKTPMVLELETGKNYAWCACGRSSNQPWCDGSHKTTSIKPVIFKLEADKKSALCMCKKTGNQPYCDGSHNHLK